VTEINDPLSERELEILRLVATGAANKEIARQLVISPNTVKVHLRNIFVKIDVASRTEATLYALKIGLVKPESVTNPDEEPAIGPAVVGLPGVEREDHLPADRDSSAVVNTKPSGRSGRPSLKIWQILLIILLALFLIGAGVMGTRLLSPRQSPTPMSAPVDSTTNTPAEDQPVVETPVITQQSWAARASLPAPRKGMGVADYQNDFYLIAGETASGIDGTVLRYQTQNDTWIELSSKPTPVSDVQAVLLGEKIYVPGGRLANEQTADCLEVYDPRQDHWETRASLPVPLSAYALATLEGKLYLFGGKNGSQYVSNVYIYDPVEDQWSEGTPLTSPRAYASAIASLGKIFVIGGYDGTHALALNEAYFPARDENHEAPWETLSPMPQGRYAMGAAHLVGTIYLAGGLGEDGEPASPSGLTYIEQSDQWAQLNSTPPPSEAYLSMLASGNFLYILGGEADNNLSAGNHSYQAIYTIVVPLISQDGQP